MTTVSEAPPWARASWARATPRRASLDLVTLGFDPGLATFGVVAARMGGAHHVGLAARLFESEHRAGKHRKGDAADLERRARELAPWLGAVVDEFGPVVVVAEQFNVLRDSRATAMLAMAWGVIDTVLEARRIPCVTVPPTVWRSFLVGRRPVRGGTAREARRRVGTREAQSHREAERRLPDVGRAILRFKSDQRRHLRDALGVWCWGTSSPVVRSILDGNV